MLVKAFACDLDKTLTNETGLIDLEAVKLVRRLEAAGYPVVFITARPPLFTAQLGSFIGTCGLLSAENGGVICDLRKNAFGLDPIIIGDINIVKEAYNVLKEELGDVVKGNFFGLLSSCALQRTFEISLGNRILKKRKIPAHLVDTGMIFSLMDARVDKGVALAKIAEKAKFKPENVVAIADNFNDVPMFKAAGYSAAVANAPEEVKKSAGYVCKRSYGEGFIEAVEHAMKKFGLTFK